MAGGKKGGVSEEMDRGRGLSFCDRASEQAGFWSINLPSLHVIVFFILLPSSVCNFLKSLLCGMSSTMPSCMLGNVRIRSRRRRACMGRDANTTLTFLVVIVDWQKRVSANKIFALGGLVGERLVLIECQESSHNVKLLR